MTTTDDDADLTRRLFTDDVDVDIDDADDNPVLVGPAGRSVDTWREGYPYDQRVSRREDKRIKRVLQIELLRLQRWVKDSGERVVILFEGRDAAGKGGRQEARPDQRHASGAQPLR